MQKRKRAPVYPARRRITLIEFLSSSDLWMAVYFFVVSQLSLGLVIRGGVDGEYSTYYTIAGLVLGAWTVTHGLMTSSRRQVTKIRYDIVSKGQIAAVVFGLFAFVYVLSFIMLSVGVAIPVQPNQESVNVIMQSQFLPMLFMTVLVAPIAEELIFRELLPYAGGRSVMSFVISSVAFTLMHSPAGITGWLMYGGVSLAFLYLRLKGNNVMQAIYGHMAYNLLSVLLGLL